MKVRVLIKKKEGVLDIEGKAIKNALLSLDKKSEGKIGEVLKGTFVEMEFNGNESEIESFVNKACGDLLVNDVIESFEYHILK